MSTSTPQASGSRKPDEQRKSIGEWIAARPRWEKIVLGAATLALVGGGIWSLLQGDPEPAQRATGDGAGSALGSNLVGGGTRTTGGGEVAAAGEDASEPAAKGFFRLGFSFLAGYCVGAFLRATLKIAAIAVGFWLLMTFALSYIGIVQVDWHAMQSLWDTFASNVESEWGNFQDFMLGSLPATGLAVTGFLIAIKRR